MRFALNHITAPNLPLEAFFATVRNLGMTQVEIRNDLPNVVGTTAPADVKSAARQAGVTIVSINALYPFNVWSEDLSGRAVALADYAAECGAQALVMCPLNDGTGVPFDQLVAALEAMKPVLEERGLAGWVEPLGFPVSSLRTKEVAIEAIKQAGGERVYKLVHDTFHHHLAGETGFYPEWTSMVHISGVTDPGLAVADMQDAHRGLVDGEDRIGNVAQIKTMIEMGFEGPYSFEPFSPAVHNLKDSESAVRQSMDYIKANL